MTRCRVAPIALMVGLVIAGCTGCTSLRWVDAPPQDLRDSIRDGSLVHRGDQVVAVTRDGESVGMEVAAVNRGFIHGQRPAAEEASEVSVEIDEIVALRKRGVDVGRTVLALGIGYAVAAAAVATLVFVEFGGRPGWGHALRRPRSTGVAIGRTHTPSRWTGRAHLVGHETVHDAVARNEFADCTTLPAHLHTRGYPPRPVAASRGRGSPTAARTT